MIIWINGAFGSGKTTVAKILHNRIENSFIYDPENVGQFLWSNEPDCMKSNDFQDEPLWREFNFKMLKNIDEQFSGYIIVPMTIRNKNYYDEIIGRLRDNNVKVHHFTLSASREVLINRLSERPESERIWAEEQIDFCVTAFLTGDFEGIIDTDDMPAEEASNRIIDMIKSTKAFCI